VSRSEGLKRAWQRGAYKWRRRVWTQAQRDAQAERMRRRNADPKFMAARVAGMRTEEFKAGARRRLNVRRRDPVFAARQRAAVGRPEKRDQMREVLRALWRDPAFRRAHAAGREARIARKRGGSIPAGYEQLYRYLRVNKKMRAADALRVVRFQRGADLKRN
jgi:hypothetical protein